MKTCALTHWLTLGWISEERVLTGGAAFDSQPSKGWFNKIRIGQSTAHTHSRACVCVSQLLSLYFTRLCHCVIASLLLVGFSLRLESLMADCGEIELYLSSFIPISHCIPPSQRSCPPIANAAVFPSLLHPADDSMRMNCAAVRPHSEKFMWQNDI